jgi:MbtH protein
MSIDEEDDQTLYRAVVNHEEQYSIWPVHRELPLGWRDAGKSGSKRECLDWIQEVWTDMRPLSLRQAMEAQQRDTSNNPEASNSNA